MKGELFKTWTTLNAKNYHFNRQLRGRSKLSTFIKAYREYAFKKNLPKAHSKMLIFLSLGLSCSDDWVWLWTRTPRRLCRPNHWSHEQWPAGGRQWTAEWRAGERGPHPGGYVFSLSPHQLSLVSTRVVFHLPAVTPLTLLELCLAFPAVTPQHCYDAPPTNRRAPRAPHACTTPAGVKCMCTRRVKSGHSATNINPKDTKKSPIHENAEANITCDFGDCDISRLGVAYLTHAIHLDNYLDYIKIEGVQSGRHWLYTPHEQIMFIVGLLFYYPRSQRGVRG